MAYWQATGSQEANIKAKVQITEGLYSCKLQLSIKQVFLKCLFEGWVSLTVIKPTETQHESGIHCRKLQMLVIAINIDTYHVVFWSSG